MLPESLVYLLAKATALVSVLIDDSDQQDRPQFDRKMYHFELDLAGDRAWPRPLGQVHARFGNGSEEPLFYSLLADGQSRWSVDSQNGWLRAERMLTEAFEGDPAIEFEVRACLQRNASSCGSARVQVQLAGQKQKDGPPEAAGHQQQQRSSSVEQFEQFRYELDLSDQDVLPQGTELLRLQLRQRRPGVRLRLLATPTDGQLPQFSLEQPAIEAEDLELDPQTGQLRVNRDLHFSLTGPTRTRQFTVQAVQGGGGGQQEGEEEEEERIVASSTLLVTSRTKEEAEKAGAGSTAQAGARRIQFIPLPKTVFLAPSKQPGSTILRVSVRAQDPRDGSWHLLPLAAFQSGDGQPMQVDYSLADPSGQFSMRDNLLLLDRPLQPGLEMDLTIRARLQRRHPMMGEPASEEIRASTAEHALHVVVMGQDGRQRYPVFERISYEFQIDPNGQFPATLPPLNASLAGNQQIRFSLFPARSGDPTDGLEMHPQTGQLRVHRHFLDNFPDKRRGGEVFLVVRAINEDTSHQQFYSDAGVALVVRSKAEASSSALQFDSPLYRFVLREDQPPGSIVNGGAAIHLLSGASSQHGNARLRLESTASDFAKHFSLLANGSLQLLKAVDLEQLEDSSRGIIQMEVVAEESDEAASSSPSHIARARVEVQVQDLDEHVPDFVPLFPQFHLHLPVNAGQPIGRLSATDQDFTDRRSGGNNLSFRAISGNASHLVHVQRDGLLLVKDPNAEPGLYTLLAEVRDSDGLIARTTAKFVLTNQDVEEEAVTSTDANVATNKVDEKGTTVDVPLPDEQESNGRPNNTALFSVRDSIDSKTDARQQPRPVLRFVLEQNPDDLFRLDANSGELFLDEETAFGAIQPATHPLKEEYEVHIRVEQGEGEEEESAAGKRRRVVARRVYTVRLVPRTPLAVSNSTESSARTTTTTTTSPNTEKASAEEEEGEQSSTGGQPAATTELAVETASSDQRRTRWTLAQRTGQSGEEEAITTSQQRTMTTQRSPTPRPLEHSRSAVISDSSSETSVPTSSTGGTSIQIEQPHFSLSRYHWIVARPVANGLVGRLEVHGTGGGEMSIEPAQFRQWFRIDPRSGELHLREVPAQLFGRQRAEFRVQLGTKEEPTAETSVMVDLNLPLKGDVDGVSATEISPTTVGTEELATATTESETAETTVEIAENSDQTGPLVRRPPSAVHGTTLTAIDTRFTVSISPMRFGTSEGGSREEEETEASTTQQVATARWTNSAEAVDSHEQQQQTIASSSSNRRTTTTTTTTTVAAAAEGTAEPLLKFGSAEFKAMLPEGRYGHTGAQLSLRPHSLAQGMPAGVQFSIEEEQQEGPGGQPLPFFVHRLSGDLIALAEIDREERSRYQFRVKAVDPANGQSAVTLVTVQILDVNDNFPQFLEPLVRVVAIGRLSPAGARLAHFRAIDPDEGAHGQVSFRIEQDPSGGGWFRMDAVSGELALAKAVPSEEEDDRDLFELVISALDGGRPALRTEHHVRVEVFPESAGLSGPEFRRAEYDAGKLAASAAQNGTFVWQVSAGPSEHFKYGLVDPPVAHLFDIDPESGQIRMGRRPLDSERGRQWALNVSATEGAGPKAQSAHTLVKVFLEPLPVEMEKQQAGSSTAKPAANGTASTAAEQCQFAERVFHAELPENTEGRQRLLTLRTVGCDGRRVHFTLNQSSDAFQLDGQSGELFAVAPLDRERKSLHFLAVNLTSVKSGLATVHEVELSSKERAEAEAAAAAEEGDDQEEERRTKRRGRQSQEQQTGTRGGRGREVLFNGLVEQAKAKLADNQALVLIRVLDRNDNSPQFQQVSQDGQIVFAVDWQAPVLQAIGRVQAHDPDEQPRLQFSLEGGDGVFAINATSGVVQLMKSLQTEAQDEFRMAAVVSDGQHSVRAPVTVYKLQPGTNIALLVIDQPADQVDVLRAVRHLNALLTGLEVDVLVKQVFIGDDGVADPHRTHLLTFALDKQSRVPVSAARLKQLLEVQLNGAQNSSSPAHVPDSPLRHLASIYVPDYGTAPLLTSAEITLLVVSALLVFCVCGMLFTLLRCCKRRQELITKSDLEYMLDSQAAGPRPYNVELITRKAAQVAQLASRRLPDPAEECTMTPESRATMVASSGIYGQHSAEGSQLGGPLRRTARAESSSVEQQSPPQLSVEQKNLLRPQRGRAGRTMEAAERLNKGYERSASPRQQNSAANSSTDNSPEAARAVRGAPPPPPVNTPQVRQQKPRAGTASSS